MHNMHIYTCTSFFRIIAIRLHYIAKYQLLKIVNARHRMKFRFNNNSL